MRFRKLQAVLCDWTVTRRAADEEQAGRVAGRGRMVASKPQHEIHFTL